MTDQGHDIPSGQRIDRAFFNRALYPETDTVRPRFQDLDPLNHINNTAMAAMFEDARVRFNYPMRKLFRHNGARTLIGGIVSNYIAEAHMNPEIVFHMGIGRIGRTSWTLQTVAWQGDHPVYYGLATMVMTRDGRPMPMPERLRDMLEARRLTPPGLVPAHAPDRE